MVPRLHASQRPKEKVSEMTMHNKLAILFGYVGRMIGILLILSVVAAVPALAQQDYVGRWDVYGGFTPLVRPSLDLTEYGFNFQGGYRATTWVTLGFDYSVATGSNVLASGMLAPALASQLGAQLGQMAQAGLIPPNYTLAVPTNARTQTFQAGTDFPIRKFKTVTFYVRPNLGAMQLIATLRPADPIAKAVVAGLAPTGKKTDWTYFYGFGGGFEINVTPHFAMRFQADFAHDNVFDGILKSGNTIRVSVGPAFQFGKNVAGR